MKIIQRVFLMVSIGVGLFLTGCGDGATNQAPVPDQAQIDSSIKTLNKSYSSTSQELSYGNDCNAFNEAVAIIPNLPGQCDSGEFKVTVQDPKCTDNPYTSSATVQIAINNCISQSLKTNGVVNAQLQADANGSVSHLSSPGVTVDGITYTFTDVQVKEVQGTNSPTCQGDLSVNGHVCHLSSDCNSCPLKTAP